MAWRLTSTCSWPNPASNVGQTRFSPLPEGRPKVTMGRLDHQPAVSPDATGPCLAITYNPMLLPKGVEPSADPMLAARAAPYGVSLGRRLSEGARQ